MTTKTIRQHARASTKPLPARKPAAWTDQAGAPIIAAPPATEPPAMASTTVEQPATAPVVKQTSAVAPAKAPTKLDVLARLLACDGGATIAQLMTATGWQAHSVRGAIAGALRKRGHAIVSDIVDGSRRYRIDVAGVRLETNILEATATADAGIHAAAVPEQGA